MKTQCTPGFLPFQAPIRREVLAQFDGETIRSDGGGLLLAEVERRTGILRQFAAVSQLIVIRTSLSIPWRN